MPVALEALNMKDASATRLNAALDIYSAGIMEQARSPIDHLKYWIANSDKYLSDKLHCLSIHRNNEVIGYLQYTFFSSESILFFDFLCIKDSKKGGLLYSKDVFEAIRRHIYDFYQHAPYKIVFEIAHKKNTSGAWTRDKRTLNYFKKAGLREVLFEYLYPGLQAVDLAKAYPAVLMVGASDRVGKSLS